MGKEDADGYVRVKIDVDTSQEKKIKRSLEDIQDDADNAKRKLDALKETGVDENAKAYRKAAEDLEKYNKELDEYIRKQKKAETTAASRTKTSQTGDFDSISDRVEDYETRLRMLRNKGYGPGDGHFDELYIAWKNAADAEKEYLAGLEKLTDRGKELEAERTRKKEETQQKVSQKREEEARRLAEQAAEYEHLNRLRANAQVRDKDLVKLLERQEAITARMAELKRAGVGEGYKEYDSLSKQLKDVNSSIVECRDGLKKVGKSSKKTLETLNKNTRKSSGMFGMLASRLKGLALSLLIFNWISKGFNAMVAAMKEGFKNLASYSKEYNSVMSAFMSSLAELKNNLAAAFEPIVNTVVPYLTRMVSGLNAAIESFSRFIAYMSGKNTYTRAKKQMLDYKSTVDSTNKSLADFDKLHVLNDNSSGGEKTGADAFETVNIGEVPESFKQFKNIYESYVKPVFERFKKAITWFGGEANGILTNIFGDIADGAGNLWNSIKNLCDQVRPYLEPLFDNIKRLFTVLFEVMSGIWESIGAPIFGFIVQLLQDTIDYFAGHTGEMSDAFGEFVDNVEDSWENHLKPALEAIGNFLDEWLLPVFREAFKKGILPMIGDTFKAIDELVNNSFLPIFNGICEFLEGTFSLDFEKAMNGIKSIVRGVINGIIILVQAGINIVIDGINAIIGAWNSIASKVHAPTLDLAGKVSLPKLQEDGSWSSLRVGNTSRGYDSETGRTYGGHKVSGNTGESVFYGNSNPSYKYGALSDWKNNNGLSNSVKAGSTFGGNENNTYIFEAKLDGQTLFKEVVNQDKLQKKRTGYSALAD